MSLILYVTYGYDSANERLGFFVGHAKLPMRAACQRFCSESHILDPVPFTEAEIMTDCNATEQYEQEIQRFIHQYLEEIIRNLHSKGSAVKYFFCCTDWNLGYPAQEKTPFFYATEQNIISFFHSCFFTKIDNFFETVSTKLLFISADNKVLSKAENSYNSFKQKNLELYLGMKGPDPSGYFFSVSVVIEHLVKNWGSDKGRITNSFHSATVLEIDEIEEKSSSSIRRNTFYRKKEIDDPDTVHVFVKDIKGSEVDQNFAKSLVSESAQTNGRAKRLPKVVCFARLFSCCLHRIPNQSTELNSTAIDEKAHCSEKMPLSLLETESRQQKVYIASNETALTSFRAS